MFLLMVGKLYEVAIMHGVGDRLNQWLIIRFGSGIADWGTDIIFTAVLFENKSYLRWYSLACILLSYVMSCIVSLYLIEGWRSRKNTTNNLLRYLTKYGAFMYFITAFTGFYSALFLLTTKLFGRYIFNLQLRYLDVQMVQNFRFVNVCLLEVECMYTD